MKFQTYTDSSFMFFFSDLQLSDVALKGQQNLRAFSSLLHMKLLFGVSCSMSNSEGLFLKLQTLMHSTCSFLIVHLDHSLLALSWFALLFQDSNAQYCMKQLSSLRRRTDRWVYSERCFFLSISDTKTGL